MLTFLPAFALAVATPTAVDAPRDAGSELTALLASADTIDWVSAKGPTIAFGIERGDASFRVAITTRAGGEVATVQLAPVAATPRSAGALGWLADELRDADAIARVAADADGAITIATRDGRSYMIIPGRGSGGAGNAAVEARWAAAWN